jgi:hypothetical protein
MATWDEARNFYRRVVDPAIDQLCEEYNAKEGFSASTSGDRLMERQPGSLAEAYSLSVSFPDGTEKAASVSWEWESDNVFIGRLRAVGGQRELDMATTTIDDIKQYIRMILG